MSDMAKRAFKSLAVLAMLAAGLANAADPLPRLGLDRSQITASGLSSGGYMAVQLHIAYSSTFRGAGVVAGGPYRCAENSFFHAIGRCMARPADIDVNHLLSITQQSAKDNAIDSTAHLKDSKVYLYSGTLDSTVKPGVVLALKAYYEAMVNPKNIVLKNNIASEHAMVTDRSGKACASKESPFINDCQFDLAGAMLSHLYPNLKPPSARPLPAESLVEFDQTEFIAGHGMANTGFAYVPKSCSQGKASCRLHVALHGCRQNTADVKLEFIQNAGYNRWAEENKIVILYPQTGKGAVNSCWDWWGYDSPNYAKQSGPQMAAIKAMVDRLVSLAAR